jgi:hypothetical protein
MPDSNTRNQIIGHFRLFNIHSRESGVEHSVDGVGEIRRGSANLQDREGTVKMQIKNHFKERVNEWMSACAMFAFGCILLTPYITFRNPSFATLAKFADEDTWGYFTMLLGLARLTVLAINGLWLPSYKLRSLCAFFSIFIWLQVTLGLFWSNPYSLGLALITPYLFGDFWAVYHGVRDYRIVTAIREATHDAGRRSGDT